MIASTFRITAFSLALILLTGLAYPLAVTGIAQTVFPQRANGSLIEENGAVIGSKLIGQNFTDPRYFHSRPSAVDYAADNSGASNLGVTSADLEKTFADRADALKTENGDADIPADLVMASGSGLDPDITPEAAQYQAARVAAARNLDVEAVRKLIDRMTAGRTLGIFGMPRVNVLAINRELDKMSPK